MLYNILRRGYALPSFLTIFMLFVKDCTSVKSEEQRIVFCEIFPNTLFFTLISLKLDVCGGAGSFFFCTGYHEEA